MPLITNDISLSRDHCKTLQTFPSIKMSSLLKLDLSNSFKKYKIATEKNNYDDQLVIANSLE